MNITTVNDQAKLESYIMFKTPSKLSIRFQRYTYFSDAQNNKIHRKFNAIIACISKSILASSDSFCLITSHYFLLPYECVNLQTLVI